MRGLETREPTYGLPAVWIEDVERERARAARYTLVDAATVFATHLGETLRLARVARAFGLGLVWPGAGRSAAAQGEQ